ncbi:MAG TPA: cytochrome c oxidase accessory protein CcoG [Candidatus Methylomirabilis sp.]|nr:cytochrome c oxidase accessory protein CcoG [Candidatus Methylomirabilis sp.]
MKPQAEQTEREEKEKNIKQSETRVPSLVESQEEIARAAAGRKPRVGRKSLPLTERVIPIAEADAVAEALYAKRQRIFPREVHGFFANLRVVMASLTLGIYYFLPWFNWGEGRQAFLIDLPNRKFNLFAWTFWPQDLFYLTAILVVSALSLFLFTAIAGRVWCGFTCPQTVWTEVFLWIERKIEGDRPKQMKLAQMPWNREKLLKKGGKHVVWIAFALWTGFTFVGYVTPIRSLGHELMAFALGPWETFWILFYGFATYGNAGWLREQVCTYMCPYARFQGAMFDRNTLIISYDQERGEPRGSRKRGDDYKSAGKGDCIDCTLCVQVCPTGIDIRNGLQYQCIACAACVDVCDSVMGKMDYPKGLIRYTSENAMEHKSWRVLRPRVLIYTGLLALIAAALVIAVLLRVPLKLDVLRDRNALYRETFDGLVENSYTLKVMNMDSSAHRYIITARGIDGLKLQMDRPEVTVAAGEVMEVPVRLQADEHNLRQRSTPIYFRTQAADAEGLSAEQAARFLGPAPQEQEHENEPGKE